MPPAKLSEPGKWRPPCFFWPENIPGVWGLAPTPSGADQSGQKRRIAGIDTATTRISSGRPMRQ